VGTSPAAHARIFRRHDSGVSPGLVESFTRLCQLDVALQAAKCREVTSMRPVAPKAVMH
jgi:hypothetical protein